MSVREAILSKGGSISVSSFPIECVGYDSLEYLTALTSLATQIQHEIQYFNGREAVRTYLMSGCAFYSIQRFESGCHGGSDDDGMSSYSSQQD
jgi:hypothetical protein